MTYSPPAGAVATQATLFGADAKSAMTRPDKPSAVGNWATVSSGQTVTRAGLVWRGKVGKVLTAKEECGEHKDSNIEDDCRAAVG